TAGGGATTTAPAADGDICTEERRGGELTFGVGSLMARGLDPTVALGTGVAGAPELSALFATPMRDNPDTGEVETHRAERLEPHADATDGTPTLPEGVRFGTGDPRTAGAVRFSVERLGAGAAAASGMAQEVESMDVADDRTLVFPARRAWGGLPYCL